MQMLNTQVFTKSTYKSYYIFSLDNQVVEFQLVTITTLKNYLVGLGWQFSFRGRI